MVGPLARPASPRPSRRCPYRDRVSEFAPRGVVRSRCQPRLLHSRRWWRDIEIGRRSRVRHAAERQSRKPQFTFAFFQVDADAAARKYDCRTTGRCVRPARLRRVADGTHVDTGIERGPRGDSQTIDASFPRVSATEAWRLRGVLLRRTISAECRPFEASTLYCWSELRKRIGTIARESLWNSCVR